MIWDAVIPSAVLPEHHNTYMHPDASGKGKSKGNKDKANKKGKSGLSARKAALAYPEGTGPGILRLADQKPKYRITTPAGKMQGLENCTLHLRYNIQPWVGALVWSEGWKWFSPPAWKALGEGAHSAPFELPEVGDASKSKADLQTETGAEANRGSPA